MRSSHVQTEKLSLTINQRTSTTRYPCFAHNESKTYIPLRSRKLVRASEVKISSISYLRIRFFFHWFTTCKEGKYCPWGEGDIRWFATNDLSPCLSWLRPLWDSWHWNKMRTRRWVPMNNNEQDYSRLKTTILQQRTSQHGRRKGRSSKKGSRM